MNIKVAVHEEDTQGNVYTLLEPIRFLELTVPAGFRSDGASVPRFFWRIVFPPGDSKALHAAIIHDFMYRTHPEGWTKERADMMFRVLLLDGGVEKWRADLAYWGVKLFGKRSWNS